MSHMMPYCFICSRLIFCRWTMAFTSVVPIAGGFLIRLFMATSLVSLPITSNTKALVASWILTGERLFASMRIHVNSQRAWSREGSDAARTRIATLALRIGVRRLLWERMSMILWPLSTHLRINRRHLLTVVWRRRGEVGWKRPLLVMCRWVRAIADRIGI